ncbi:MAG: flagellar filament capping protein FliD [Pseudomonadota bacterium]
MSDTGQSIISALGAGSGIDFNALANDLSEASYSFQREDLEARNDTLLTQISEASILRSTLNELASATGDRVRTGDLAPQGTIGDPSVAQITVPSGAAPSGGFSLEVTQLAESQTLVLPSYTSGEDLVGEGSLRIRFGTVSGSSFTEDTAQTALDISVSATDTLDDLAAKITLDSDGALEAYVAQGTNGAQLVVKGRDGAVNGFVLEPTSAASSPTDVPGDLTYLAWSPDSDTGELRSGAQDALFLLDTVEISSSTNQISDLPGGFALNLTGTNEGAPTTIEFSQDQSAITTFMNDFVAALNDVVSLLNGGEDEATSLSNDPGARELRLDLSRLTSEIVIPNAEEGEPNSLADLGLSLNRDGTFRIDSERLEETLTNSPDAAAAMFTTGVFGVFATIDGLARDNTAIGDPGSLGGSVTRYEDQIERNDERLERIAEQQENLRAQLARSFNAAQSQIAVSQSTLSFIEQQFATTGEG